MFTQEQLSILNEYVKKIKILKTYNLITNEPISYKGKIINITPLFGNTQVKKITIDVPINNSVEEIIQNPDGSSTTQYSTTILRFTIELNDENISWLLTYEADIDNIGSTFFDMIKQSYQQTQKLPTTLESYIGKSFN